MKILAALSTAALCCHVAAQNTPREASSSVAEKLVVASLSFQQGDLASLKHAHENFTSKGWDEFIKKCKVFSRPMARPHSHQGSCLQGPP
jgi:hypothetical protein